ncbi:hypothetical protein U1Q18_051463 [Sarracenia purpurea var. burkii]
MAWRVMRRVARVGSDWDLLPAATPQIVLLNSVAGDYSLAPLPIHTSASPPVVRHLFDQHEALAAGKFQVLCLILGVPERYRIRIGSSQAWSVTHA